MKLDLDLRLRKSEKEAAKLIDRFGIYEPDHIRMPEIAYSIGVSIVEGPLPGASARLIRIGEYGTIRIPNTETNESRKRFSIAHELGHFVLKHGHSLEMVCNDEDMMNWNKKDEETEANFFAAELILPEKLIRHRCDVKNVNFTPIRKIAEDFHASLTATAIRFVRFCPEPCALICSQSSYIKWFYKSPEWWPYIQTKRKLDSRTVAMDFFIGKEMINEPIGIEADAWLDNTRGLNEIIEHSIALDYYKFVLTILWIKPSR
jgi:hypothetical protein